MVLSEERRLDVCTIEGSAANPINPLQQIALRVSDLDRPRQEASFVPGVSDAGSKLQVMRAAKCNRRMREDLDPLKTARVALLLAEIVSGVSGWSQDHVLIALSPDPAVEPFHR